MTYLSAHFRSMRKPNGLKDFLPFNFLLSVFEGPGPGPGRPLSQGLGSSGVEGVDRRVAILRRSVADCNDPKPLACLRRLDRLNYASCFLVDSVPGRLACRTNSFGNTLDFTRLSCSQRRRSSIASNSAVLAFCSSLDARRVGRRMYSTNDREPEGRGNEPRTEMKGVVVHIPNPVDWLKNLWYLFIVQGWLDSSFSRQEFLYGAKQALCHLTRLAVLKDFDSMKLVASTEVVGRMKEITSSLSMEQLQSIEILPENINMAKFNVSSVRYQTEGFVAVSIDVFCLAIRMFRSQPLLIQMLIRFGRNYEHDRPSDWRIVSIQEFNIRELGASKDEGRGRPK